MGRLSVIAGLVVALLVAPGPNTALADAGQVDTDRALIQDDFEVPDLADQVGRLRERFQALVKHLAAVEQRLSLTGVDERLDELFLPEKPNAFKHRYRRELDIAAAGGTPAQWQTLAEHYLEHGALLDAAVAAYQTYRDSTVDGQRARALVVLAEARLARGEIRLAINLYNGSLKLNDDHQTRQRFNVLIERHDLRVVDLALDVERELPSACLVFTQTLARRLPLPVADYVSVEPAADIDIAARDNQICLNGVLHGGDYTVSLRPGLRGAEGAQMHGPITRRFQVPDRTARILFAKKAYVLPAASADAMPVNTVNLDSIELRLYRIDDRNLVAPLLSDQLDRDLYPGAESAIAETSGRHLWSGTLAIDSQRNREVTTLIPVREMLPETRPGLYALVARPEDPKQQSRYRARATQWLVLSDLGLVSYQGADGLHVLARSLETARPVGAATLALVARNNTVLGTSITNGDGIAHFPPGLLRGGGGVRAAFVTAATEAGDYNFLRLTGAALDLSGRGVGGRAQAGGLDAFLYAERGIYRPGETVYLSAVLRDAEANATAGLPLTVKVLRPGGTEMFHLTTTGDALGGYGFELPLSPAARAGAWVVSAFVDSETAPVGSTRFQVEDFVPPRLEAEFASNTPWLAPGAVADLVLTSRYLYGAPAADLATEARYALLIDPTPYPEHSDYKFGLVQETYHAQRQALDGVRTDADGNALIRLSIDAVPDTSHPLHAVLTASVLDMGGRPVDATIALPMRTRAVEVGLRPQFNGALGPDDEAGFDLLALDRDGAPVPSQRLGYEWIREEYDYSWYQQNGEWRFRTTVYDEVVAAGDLVLNYQGQGAVTRRLGSGRYRLDVFDTSGGSAASYRFSAGWWYGVAAPDVPDGLELSLERADLGDGEILTAFIRAPFAGSAVITVMNDRLRHSQTLDLPATGTNLSLPVDASWGPGAYLLVTAFRPDSGVPSPVPTRALGLAWFSIDRGARSLQVAIDIPEVVTPRQTIELPIRVINAEPGKRLRLTLAAVDDGILQLTDFLTPRPADHYYGQRRLAMDIRDLYGRLIRPAEGQPGRLRSGGDGVTDNAQGIALRTVKSVAIYHRDIEADDQGRATVSLDLPDFNGRLRLMALAYGPRRTGSGEARLVVRDPLIADVLLPRFLAVDDQPDITLALHNLSGAAQKLSIDVSASGAVAVAAPASASGALEPRLDVDQRDAINLTLTGRAVGKGKINLVVTGDGIASIARSWDIEVRAAQPFTTQRSVQILGPGETATLTAASYADQLPETLSVNTTVTAGVDFNLTALLEDLDRYPYGCTEQTLSRALPLFYYGDLAEQVALARDDQDSHRRVDRSIRRVLERQRGDGAFGVWHSYGRGHPWLTAYSFDFLTRAREAGYDVPPAAYQLTQSWLARFAKREQGLRYARAYAYYVLARIGEARAGDLRYFAETHGNAIQTRLGRGHIAAALAMVGEADRAEALYEQAIAHRRPAHTSIADYGSDLRDGAAIAALLAEGGTGTDRLARLATALERAFDRREYFSTQEQVWLVMATHAVTQTGGADMRVSVNGGAPVSQSTPLRRHLNAAALAAGYRVENQGNQPIRIITAARAVRREALPATADGFELTRTWYQTDGRVNDLSAVTQNDRFVVVLEGRSLNARDQHALITDLLPAGFEIENPALGSAEDRSAFPFLPQLSDTSFSAARDDRYVAAVDLNGKRRFAVAYLVRAVTPGVFSLPGAFIEDMYRPQYFARGANRRLIIGRR